MKKLGLLLLMVALFVEPLSSVHATNNSESKYVTHAEFMRDAVEALYGEPELPANQHGADPYYDYAAKKLGILYFSDLGGRPYLRDAEITRGEAARVIYLLLNKEIGGVKSKAIRFLFEKNLACGAYNDKGDYMENYNPTGKLARESAAVLIERAKAFKNGEQLKSCQDLGTSEGLNSTILERFESLNKKMHTSFKFTTTDEEYNIGIWKDGLLIASYGYDEIQVGTPFSFDTWSFDYTGTPNEKDLAFFVKALKMVGMPESEETIKMLLDEIVMKDRDVSYSKANITVRGGGYKLPNVWYKNYSLHWANGEFAQKPPETSKVPPSQERTSWFYVDGHLITDDQNQPDFSDYAPHVPIQTVVEGMGDKFEWNDTNKSGIIRLRDGKKISIAVNSSFATEDGLKIPKPKMIKWKLYVSVYFLSDILKYSMDFEKKENREYVFIGQPPVVMPPGILPTIKPTPCPTPSMMATMVLGEQDLRYKVADDWKPPLIQSTATWDPAKDHETLKKELGLGEGWYFSPYCGKENTAALSVTGGGIYSEIVLYGWYGSLTEDSPENKTPYIVREILRFYLPGTNDKLFHILDDGFMGEDVGEYVNKKIVIDDHEILIQTPPGGVQIYISQKGKKIDLN
ncbi:stalk domain-containing protein [Paenibacillus hamazuiensis]|uniref:stalk domain-containing protein n=1 Tax=Paenibacillus hamazuiensis TaxID=2936508 RepID=UPI00200D6364|nr:stalk domain-containing protein [Paenibacillus hamazuiensis]